MKKVREMIKKMPIPGHRIIKTAICVVLCLIAYHFLDRDGLMLALTGTIFSMHDSVEKSIESAKFRILGTIVGGLFGAAFISLRLTSSNFWIFLLFVFLGTIIFFYVCTIAGIKQASGLGTIVFLIIMIDGGQELSPILFSLDRVIDSMIGIIISVVINVSLFRPKSIDNTVDG
ncbi:MAG: aromatic acid exporter family protein [Defluviitaleaceae bacterium]|nr:aromatic acid exporter family protein [Defluviitaleaceae bacterium]